MPESATQQSLAEVPLTELVACHECDLLMRRPEIADGERVECPRCGYELYSHRPQVIRRSLALVLAALLLYIPANFQPIMQMTMLGQSSHDTVWSGVLGLYDAGMQSIAVVVFLCSMAVPLLKLLCQLLVLLSICLKVGQGYGFLLYRIYHHMREWGMLEVYLIGILVSIVKLADIAELSIGFGLFCFIALLLVQVWLEVTMSPHQIWEALAGEDAHARH